MAPPELRTTNLEIEEHSTNVAEKPAELINQIETQKASPDGGFKHLSRYLAEENTHQIQLGIQLSAGHPVLSNFDFQKEMTEKIKGLQISVDSHQSVSSLLP